MLENSYPDKGCVNNPVFHKLYSPQYYVSDFIDVWKIWWRPLKTFSSESISFTSYYGWSSGKYFLLSNINIQDPIWTIASLYSNASQTRGSKLAKFSNSRFLSLLYTSKLAVLLLSTQIRDFCYFLSPKNREFGGITVSF